MTTRILSGLTKAGLASLTAVTLAACTTTGQVERGALGGAAAGAAVGAGVGAISGDVKVGEGAAVGAVVGGVAGAIVGNNRDRAMNGGTSSAPILDKSTRYFDEGTRRYYYYEKGTGRTFYENGEYRAG